MASMIENVIGAVIGVVLLTSVVITTILAVNTTGWSATMLSVWAMAGILGALSAVYFIYRSFLS